VYNEFEFESDATCGHIKVFKCFDCMFVLLLSVIDFILYPFVFLFAPTRHPPLRPLGNLALLPLALFFMCES
jgi:hypothetical protein